MKTTRNLLLTRRSTLIGTSATLTLLATSPLDAAGKLLLTPPQTEGPFYPENWVGDIDNDLVVVKGEAAKALGQVLHLEGTVQDIKGNPVPSALVEIWQCDANGIYHHSEDESPTRRHDKGFQGYGRTLTDNRGRYTFRTIKPVPYPGRTPHIHFRVKTPAKQELTTQMYIFGEQGNSEDFLLNSIRNQKQRNSLIVKLNTAEKQEANALRGVFDIVLR